MDNKYIIEYYKIPNKYLKSIVGKEPRIDDIIKTKRKEYKIINYKYCSGGRYKAWVLETNAKNNEEVKEGDFVY